MLIFRQFSRFIHNKFYWPLILTGGYFLRALAGWYLQHQQLPDAVAQYMPIAEALAFNQGFVSAKSPGYIFFLAPIMKVFGKGNYLFPAILIQSAVSILLCYVLYKITVNIFRSETAGRIAAGIAAFYPWLIYYSTQLSLELWFTFWVALSVYYSIQFDKKQDYLTALKLGLTLGFTSYIRTVFMPYTILALLVFILRKIPLKKILCVLLIVLCFVFGWSAYNKYKIGQWTFTGGNADHNLYLGLNAMNKTGGGIWGRDAPSLDEIRDMLSKLPPDIQKNWYKNEVKKFVLENPVQVVILAAKKMYIFWRPYPTAEGYTNIFTIAIIFGSFAPLVIFSVWTLWSFRKNKNYILLVYPILYIAQLNAIHLVFSGSLVYRFPIEPLLICMASYGLSKLLPEE